MVGEVGLEGRELLRHGERAQHGRAVPRHRRRRGRGRGRGGELRPLPPPPPLVAALGSAMMGGGGGGGGSRSSGCGSVKKSDGDGRQ